MVFVFCFTVYCMFVLYIIHVIPIIEALMNKRMFPANYIKYNERRILTRLTKKKKNRYIVEL